VAAAFAFGFLPILFLPVLVFYLPESIRFLVSKGKIESAVKEIRRMENAAGLDHQEWGTADFALPATPPAGGFKELFSPRLAVMTIPDLGHLLLQPAGRLRSCHLAPFTAGQVRIFHGQEL